MSDPKHAITLNAPHETVQKMHPLVERAMALNPDPATLREFLQLQRDWEEGEAKRAYTAALIALKRDLPVKITHDKTVDFTNKASARTFYTHASLAHTLEEITPALTAHGFSIGWTPKTHPQGIVEVTCSLVHRDGHSESCSISAPIDTSGSKSPAQGVASTLTLLRRYTLNSMLGIATAADTEPTGEPKPAAPTDRVDANRNLKAVTRLAKHGKTREQAEAFLRRKVQDWTAADIETLALWVEPPPPAEPAEREPGDDTGLDDF